DAFNLFNVPNEIAWGRVRRWQQRDDIYQVGLIAVMLLRGDIASPIRSRDVRTLPCSDQLKEVIHRCLGVRGKRYEAAGELMTALAHPRQEPRLGRVRGLAGKHLSFTGFLSRPRSEAIVAAKRAGAIVQAKPGRTTDVLVRGRTNALQIAGKVGGLKLMEVRRLAARGHVVTVIGDRQFWRLVAATSSRRKTNHRKRAGPYQLFKRLAPRSAWVPISTSPLKIRTIETFMFQFRGATGTPYSFWNWNWNTIVAIVRILKGRG